jgi:hypothetical protein
MTEPLVLRRIFAAVTVLGLMTWMIQLSPNEAMAQPKPAPDKKTTKKEEPPKEEPKKDSKTDKKDPKTPDTKDKGEPKKEPEMKDSKGKEKTKPAKKEDAFRDAWPKYEGTVVKILDVDLKGNTAEVENAEGKTMTITVDDKTEYFGPQGGPSKLGIRDDRFEQGLMAKILLDGKVAKKVYFAVRKSTK